MEKLKKYNPNIDDFEDVRAIYNLESSKLKNRILAEKVLNMTVDELNKLETYLST